MNQKDERGTQMGGRKKLPDGIVRWKQEVVRINEDEQADFQTAAYLLNRYRSEILRDAIFSCIETAKRANPKRFQELRKKFSRPDQEQ